MTLDEVLQETLGRLLDGVSNRHSPFRTLSLASADVDGWPDQRTVILRAFDGPARSLEVHTDSRSAKIAQLRVDRRVTLLGWDAMSRLQVRLRGLVTLHAGDTVARSAWDSLPAVSRQLYRVQQEPGTILPDPAAAQFDEGPEAAGFATFIVVTVVFSRLETLHLTDAGQMRARFDWSAGTMTANWLVP